MYGPEWVRSALSQLDFLTTTRAMPMEAAPAVRYAIEWAPFGGAGAGDLLVEFGADRGRFLEMVYDGLRIRRDDNSEARWLKQRLSSSLAVAWLPDKTTSVSSVRSTMRHRPHRDGYTPDRRQR